MQAAYVVITYALVGVAASWLIALYAVKAKVIRRGAFYVSIFVGSSVSLLGPLSVLALILFLAYATMATRLGREVKARWGVDKDAEGRGFSQVLAVGLAPSVMSIASSLTYIAGFINLSRALLASYAASLAASLADTWASEIGVLSRSTPRLIVKPWVKVSPGTSGGVTALGELSSLAGASAMALTYYALSRAAYIMPGIISYNWAYADPTPLLVIVIVALGYLGEVLDSVIGAVAQPKYLCPRCRVIVEDEVHYCGSRTIRLNDPPVRLKNEDVNMITSTIVAIIALILTLSFRGLLG